MITFIIISILLLAGFVAASVALYGLNESYSAYYYNWKDKWPKFKEFWSIVTFAVAFTLMPPLIHIGEGNALQFLGFAAPVYLVIVATHPDFRGSASARRWHVFGAIGCAICAALWVILIAKMWWVLLIGVTAALIPAIATRTIKTSYVFWGEMAMFASTYITLFVTLLR